jgi:hypothetical protein
MNKFATAAMLLVGSGLAIATNLGQAVAQGPPIVNETSHSVNEAETQEGVFPCTGQLAELRLVESGVIHITVFADGTVHFAGTLHGTLSADVLPTDGTPDFTGAFVERFGGNGLLLEQGGAVGKAGVSFVLNGNVAGADGSTFSVHESDHTVFDSAGVPKLDFSKVRCG